MARRLSFQHLILCLALAVPAADYSSALAQTAPREPACPTHPAQPGSDQPGSQHDGDKKRDGERRSDGREGRDGRGDRDGRDGRGGGGRDGRGGGRGANPDFILEVMKRDPGFLLEVVKRDGGPLELLAPLMKPEVREHLGLDAKQSTAVDQFLVDMTKRFEDDIKANKSQPSANWEELFLKLLAAENARFDEFLKKELPAEQRDRLIGIFVQYRNMRALSNRLVAIEKLGMTPEQANELRDDIHRIRMDTIRENDEWARRRIENGNTVQQNEQLHKVRAKIDARIEKLVTKPQLEKLQALRGKELPPAILDSLDRLPTPPGPPGPPPRKD